MAINGLGTVSGYGFVSQQTLDATVGLVPITPSSIANSGGSASASGCAVTFTTVNSVSLNGVFTTTYDVYKVVLYLTGGTGTDVYGRMRVSGSDDTTASSYNTQWIYAQGASSGAGSVSNNTYWSIINNQPAGERLVFDGTIYLPASAVRTRMTASVFNNNASGWTTTLRGYDHNVATAYDGFTISAPTGNLSGVVRIYGLQKT